MGVNKVATKTCVIGAGSDSVCLAAGVHLCHGGLSVGRLTQTIAVTWVRIAAMAPTTFCVKSACVRSELMVLHYSCLEFEWMPIAGQGGPKIVGQGGPRLRAKADQARGVRVKAGQDRGSRWATIRSGIKAGSGGGPRQTGTTEK